MSWELPSGWEWERVSNVLTRVKSQVHPDEIHDDWIYVGLEHVQSCTGEYQGVEAFSAGIKSAKFKFEAGDVLYGKLRPNLRKCVVAREPGVCSTDLVPLRPADPAAAHFLSLQLRSEAFTSQVMRMIGGANLPRVNMKDFFTVDVPMPPAEDQQRLYSLARSVSALRDKQRALARTIDAAERAATGAALGLVPLSPRTLRAIAQPSP